MSIEEIRNRIQALYETAPEIHADVNIKNPRICLVNEPAVITGVYQHIFRIEEHTGEAPRSHTLQYTDVLTGRIRIPELSAD